MREKIAEILRIPLYCETMDRLLALITEKIKKIENPYRGNPPVAYEEIVRHFAFEECRQAVLKEMK